jgi:general stress protein 26
VIKADDKLNIFFATFAGSRKVAQIAANQEVHVAVGTGDFENPGPYLQVQGRAEILTDSETKKAVWYEHLKNIFTGPEDPNYNVGKVTPYRIEYTIPGPGQPPEIWER